MRSLRRRTRLTSTIHSVLASQYAFLPEPVPSIVVREVNLSHFRNASPFVRGPRVFKGSVD